jgi:hypothetical protein
LAIIGEIMIRPVDVKGASPAGIIAFDRRVRSPAPTVRAYIWCGEPTNHSLLAGNNGLKRPRWGALMVGSKGSIQVGDDLRLEEDSD